MDTAVCQVPEFTQERKNLWEEYIVYFSKDDVAYRGIDTNSRSNLE